MIFGWLRKRRARRLGKDTARALISDVEEHITVRVVPAADGFIDVFCQCLMRAFDKEKLVQVYGDDALEVDPRDIIRIEWELFEEHLGEFAGHKRAEINIKTCKWDEVIADMDDIREMLDNYISERINGIVSEMRLKADVLRAAALAKIEQRSRLAR